MPVNPKTRNQTVHSYREAVELLDGKDINTIAPNTFARRSGDNIIVSLHGHDIIEFDPVDIRFSDAGYMTRTTMDRLNRFLPVHVWQDSHQWYYGDNRRFEHVINHIEGSNWNTIPY